MSTHDYSARYDPADGAIEAPVSVSRFVHILAAYKPAILSALAAIALAYLIVASAIYILSPAQRSTEQSFRLEFEGADEGLYPNGIRFSTAEIVTTPVLLKVFKDNNLARFTTFNDFSKSIVIVASNLAYERLAAEYRTRLADPRLSPTDRERVQQDWDARMKAALRNDFSIIYLRDIRKSDIPEKTVRKVLVDVLNEWASFAIQNRHVLTYQMSVISPDVINADWTTDPLVQGLVLREKLRRVLANIKELRTIPGADLVRIHPENVSLNEIHLQLEEIIRFRLEPLIFAAAGSAANKAAVLQFAETQLAHDKTQLASLTTRSQIVTQALLAYSNKPSDASPMQTRTESGRNNSAASQQPAPTSSETVMPQFSDSFIERIMTLARDPEDLKYRQKLVEQYREAAEAAVPTTEAVAFDEALVARLRTPGGPPLANGRLQTDLQAAAAEARRQVAAVNTVFRTLSQNLNPSTQLLSFTAPPITVTEHGQSIGRLALYGFLLMLVSIPAVIIGCLLHNRMRREEAAETA